MDCEFHYNPLASYSTVVGVYICNKLLIFVIYGQQIKLSDILCPATCHNFVTVSIAIIIYCIRLYCPGTVHTYSRKCKWFSNQTQTNNLDWVRRNYRPSSGWPEFIELFSVGLSSSSVRNSDYFW